MEQIFIVRTGYTIGEGVLINYITDNYNKALSAAKKLVVKENANVRIWNKEHPYALYSLLTKQPKDEEYVAY